MDTTIFKLKIPYTKNYVCVSYDVIDRIKECLDGTPHYLKCVEREHSNSLCVDYYYYEILDGYIDPDIVID